MLNKKRKEKSLNRKEENLLSSFEKGEWKTVKNVKKAKAHAKKTAKKTLHKAASHLTLK